MSDMDYKRMTASALIAECKDDASKWAAAFVRKFPDANVSEGTILAWFANAIETAHDHRMAKLDAGLRDPDPVADMDTVWEHMGLFEGRLQTVEESVRVLRHNEAQIQAVKQVRE